MLVELKEKVWKANLDLPAAGLVKLTWGNASAITPDRQYVIIKPSGVDYATMQPEQMVVVDMNGKIVEGNYRPSSDLPTHLELYRAFPQLCGIVHTHSRYATVYAQAERDIPCYGTTHADAFYGPVPCTRALTDAEIQAGYEFNTATVIIETFTKRQLNPVDVPGVVVFKHGAFTWGKDVQAAVERALEIG